MNSKSLLLGAALGLGSLSLAHATIYVYMTGSTACRSHIYNVMNAGAGGAFDAPPTGTFYQGSSVSGCTFMMWSGFSTALGDTLVVKAHWSGSEGGIKDLATGQLETFLDDVGTGSPAVVAGDNHGTTAVAGQLSSFSANVALADASVVFSKNPSADVVGQALGVITFKWVREKGSSASITSVKDSWVRSSLKNGGVRLSIITGSETDTNYVYVSGRDSDSGTRVNEFGDTGFGIFNAPKQLQVNPDGSMKQQSDLTYVGDWGYSSGGTLATQMGYDLSVATSLDLVHVTTPKSHFSVVAYLGISDANAAIGNGATEISYNGVAFSQAAVEGGQFTAWGNEYIYELSADSGTGDGPDTVFNGIATGITSEPTDDGFIQFSAMHVTRTGPTTDPVHK